MFVKMYFVYFLFVLKFCASEYYEDQPKFLTENGNFIIESAVDKNISFRLKGRGFLNVNDMNVMNILQIEAWNRSNIPNSNLALRLSELESQMRSGPVSSGGSIRLNRNLLQRLSALENRVNRGGVGSINTTVINRRIRRLELQYAQLMQRLSADNCSSNPCNNGGTCLNTFGGYICKCSDAWEGINCEEDVNECANFAGTDLGCQNMAICENYDGGYRCRCQTGWVGTHCTRRTVDCLQSPYELCGHGACVHTSDANGYRCICDQGWINNGSTPACNTDVNECNSPVPHCSKEPEVPCINLPGTYTCGQCPHGYTGNGHYCKDIDECEMNNGGCSVLPFVACINTRGSSKCAACPFGYSGDGRVCIRTIDNLRPTTSFPFGRACENNDVCHPLATCVQTRFRANCICPAGYVGDGYGPNGCTRSSSTLGTCIPNPCLNGGTCTGTQFGFRCRCPRGTIPPRCEQVSTGCIPNPCNGGTCLASASGQSRCLCPPGRTGRYCQIEARSCGGVLNALNGTLKYPLSNVYPHNSRCAWMIKTDEDKVLNVTFTKFELEESRECRFDWLQIHDGRSSASYMIGRFCGSQLPMNGNIVSTQNMLYLWFRSDNSSARDGFELTWNSTVPVCGGDLSVTGHGTIKSPGSPGNYPPNRDCIWKLTAPSNKRIQLHFFTMQLEAHETCQYDYLAIYNGLSTDGQQLEKFCNTTHPQPITSSGNELTLHFHSDDDGTDAGFQIHYSLVEGFPGCGGTFTAVRGEFGSPIQDGAYPKNIECHYQIKLPKGMKIKLQFLSFAMEGSQSCSFDYVEIYEGINENAPKAGRWCGSQIPPAHESLTNELLILFHTDWSFNAEGFRIKYETVCGGKFDDNNGVIMSPFYPQPYEHSRECYYDIEAPLGKAIVVNFTDFDIEDDCTFDALEIYDGPDTNSTSIGTFCGAERPSPAISTLNHMHLVFKTDSSISGRGFKANYSFIDSGNGCGGIIKKLNVVIAPPKSGDRYAADGNCVWVIVAPIGYLVQLTFTSLDMEAHSECRYDYLAIYDGVLRGENGSQPIGKYCGTTIPPVIQSSSRSLTLFFKSDESIGGNGFVLSYTFIDGRNLCGGKFYSPSGVIRSPNFPNSYQPSKDCVYVIQGQSGKQIELKVKSFQLEENPGCSFDSLEIRNGGNDKSPLIGTFCGTDILPNIRSFSNTLYLRFKTDSTSEYKGFEIEYDTTISGCGGIFKNSQRGSLTSPNYPEPYGANMQCDYRIHVARGSTISLIVTDLEMEADDCTMDYIAIFDGPDSSARHIGTYCQTNHLVQVETTSNDVFIRMVSDVSNQGRGFEIKFNANCQREIRDLRGVIESPNFPDSYPNFVNCSWKIIPPLGNRIFMEFSHFEVERSWTMGENHCTFDFVAIEERDSSDMVVKTNKYCSDMPKPVNTSNTVIVRFESDFSNSGGGFHLEYEVQGCGGTLNKPEGRFTSPNYPISYPHDTHCQWVIEVDYGHLIEITFQDFDFESSSGCYQDGLVVSNDQNATKILSRFCGSMHNASHPGVVTSNSNKVYIHFYSDLSYSGRGFSATYKSIPTKCGGLFTLPEGNISSINYPNNYESNSHCEWLIRTEPSHTISFLFNDFDLQNTDNCTDDVVRVYDGSNKRDDKLLLKACGNENKGIGFEKPLRSDSNELLVVMDADASFESKGFAATYSPRCGAKINTSSSGILEIGHNLRWLTEDCQWVITAENPNQHVSLTILHIDNEPVFQKYIARLSNQTLSPCLRKIFIHDGTSTSAPKIMEICSNIHPPTIVSEGNSLTVALDVVSDNDFSFSFDMKAAYSVLDNACGGEFTSVYGEIASPGYPKSYKNNIECEWTIKASPGNEMTLNINMMNIDETANCNGDYLEIRETNSIGKLIGVYCGSNIPPALPHTNTYWLKFRSDDDGVGRGFKAEYSYARIVEQNGTAGVITSQLYPSYIYYTIDSYKWRVTVARGNVIRISIDNCILKRDSNIQIYDGYDSEAGTLSTIETDNIPTDSIVSTTNVVLIEFRINTFSESKFKLIWNQIPRSSVEESTNGTNTLNCTANSVVTVARTDVLQLRSPGWPTGYDSNLMCDWTFLPGQMGYHVGLTFTAIDLEQQEGCISDYVQAGNSATMQNFNQSTKLCSLDAVGRRSRFHGTPNLKLKFRTDFAQNRTGFSAIVLLDCGGTLEGTSGVINNNMTTRPLNASLYWTSDTCTWFVNVKRGRTIQFNLEKMNLEKNSDGSCNSYIIIRNGPHDESPFLGDGKFCGNSVSTIPKTSSHQAFVQFARGRVVLKREFTLRYQQIEHDCGGYLTLNYNTNTTIITTPNYPNIPSPHIECIWRVTAPSEELLKIEFLERFDMTTTPQCTTEYLEVREGSTSGSPIVGTYCAKMPSPIFVPSNMIRLKYFTDVPVPRNGFKLQVSFARCGRSINSEKGYLVSPGYPGKGAYPRQSVCDYHVSGRSGVVYNLTFIDLDLPSATNCSTVDHIEIYSVMTNTPAILIAQLCGDEIPNSMRTVSSKLLIRFVTKSANGLYRGYRISYESTTAVCGGTIEASSGIIQSPGYPLAREFSRACEWFITVPKGRRVKVEILDFDVTNSPLQFISIPGIFAMEQKLSFYNDYFSNRIISINRANDTNAPIYSTDNKMTIQSVLRSNGGHRGFKLRFTSDEPSVCEGNFNEMNGMFQSPENVTTFYCEFERNSHQPFLASEPGRGTLSVKTVQREVQTNRTSCSANLLTGISVSYMKGERKVIVSKCPPKYNNIASPFTSMKIQLKNSLLFRYVFSYKIHACGGVFPLESQSRIVQPNFDLNYGEVDCAWHYSTRSDQSFQFIVSSYSLNCDTEYITIYDGPTPIHPRIARICGDVANNQTVVLQSQNAFIEFHSDNYQQTSKFNIEITSSDGVCGGVLNAPNYVFSSPKNGTKYPANSHCEWILRAQSGFHIGLTFPQRFMIESSDNCEKDYLEVFDKIGEQWKSLAKLCGRELPHFINSTSREMRVIFHSDATINGDGFTAAWNENCGGVFTATNQIQTISSPRHPDRYPKNIFCNYSIVAPDENQSVNIKFLKFELEETSRTCNFDNVTIYKPLPYMIQQQFEEIGTYCWHDSITTFRQLNRLDVVFRTDGFIERPGFLFEYRTDSCGGDVTEPKRIGSIDEDNKETYLPMSTCIWNITAPADKRITIRFEHFDLERVQGCYLDYVDIFEGYAVDDTKRKAKLCGNLTHNAPTININSNKAIVKFTTDASIQEKGFAALILFTKNCNEHIRLSENQRTYQLNKLTSMYEPLLNCEYTVTAPQGYVIQAKFSQFHLAPCDWPGNRTCNCDYLNIRDGGGPFSEIIGTYCGHSNPPNVYTTSNELYMRFTTDSVGFSTGFNVDLEMINSPCGAQRYELKENHTKVEIVSPMNGNSYMADMNCMWTFSADMEKLIDIKFERFDLEEDPQNKCTADYLEIKDEDSLSYIREGLGENTVYSGDAKGKNQYFYNGKQWPTSVHRYCGNGMPMDYLSTSQKVHVRFKSNEVVQKSGFKFSASIFDSCARNYTRLQGRLYSRTSVDCETHINVPDGYSITLYFQAMSYATNVACNEDNMPLKIYNDRNDELLISYCGDSLPNPLFTTTNRLRLKFRKTPILYVNNDLYDITYLASDKGSGCGGEFYNYGGTFSSPGYPNVDRNHTDCTWTINVPMNLKVALQFVVFDMGARSCETNYLEIIEFDETIEATKFCGTEVPAPYKGASNRLKVHFKSSSNFSGTGWTINFMAVHENSEIANY